MIQHRILHITCSCSSLALLNFLLHLLLPFFSRLYFFLFLLGFLHLLCLFHFLLDHFVFQFLRLFLSVTGPPSSFFPSSICLFLISQLRCFSARSVVNFSCSSFFSSSICSAFFCQSLFSACYVLRFSCRELHIVCKSLNLVRQLSSFSAKSFVNLSSRARLSETAVPPPEIQDFSVPLEDLLLCLVHLPQDLRQQDFRLCHLDVLI
ncbi:hypothetical protein FQN60_010657 [Etheostoma spectabile]|nr:hypothetical protein FQN60_010657 [Etheostoma spectabile]